MKLPWYWINTDILTLLHEIMDSMALQEVKSLRLRLSKDECWFLLNHSDLELVQTIVKDVRRISVSANINGSSTTYLFAEYGYLYTYKHIEPNILEHIWEVINTVELPVVTSVEFGELSLTCDLNPQERIFEFKFEHCEPNTYMLDKLLERIELEVVP